MRPEGVFAPFHKLISRFPVDPKNNHVDLSRLGWLRAALTPGQLEACDCDICKLTVEPVNGVSLIIQDIQPYGGIANIQIPGFDHTRTVCGRLTDLTSYQLKAQVMEAVKSIYRDHFAGITRISYPSNYHNYLTTLAVKRYAGAYFGWRVLSDVPGIEACGGSRSFVAFSKSPIKADNLVRLPVTIHSEASAVASPQLSSGAARVIDFREWITTREARDANKNKMTRQKIKRMTMREKRLRILDLISEDDMDDQTLASILEFLESIAPDMESQS